MSRTRRPAPDDSSATLFLPYLRAREADSRAAWSLSPELRGQVTRRLRLIALTYSCAYFFADFVPMLAFGYLGHFFHDPRSWAPAVGSVLAGILVAVLVSNPRWSWQAKLHLGLAFEVVGSYGIALAQFLTLPNLRAEPDLLMVMSPSWVGIWMLFFTIVVPAPPGKALCALIGSATAPLLVMWIPVHAAHYGDLMRPGSFLIHHVLPYAICVGMAYAGARVMYRMGTEVARARALGSYRLIERLGRGGMGEVWRASHQLLARPAAIKFIRPEAMAGMTDSEANLMLKRFELEARATASLTSPHTIGLYDFGVSDEGAFYYVMELLDGLDCDVLVQRFGPVPPARLVHLLVQVCESLDEAHAKGLIHRDVKPANVYVCRSGTRFDFVKVLDFGLVRHRREPGMPDPRITQPDHAVGTPQFMPPEVALGNDSDARTDLYALGCLAYWLAAGRPVFTGRSLHELIAQHLNAVPEPPSVYAPGGLPPELEALVLSCLEKDPARRPASARELARRLKAVRLADCWGDEEAEAWWRHAGLAATDPVVAT